MRDFLFDLYGTLLDIHTDEESPRFWEEISSYLYANGRKGELVKEQYRRLCREEQGAPLSEIDLVQVFRKMLSAANRPSAAENAREFARFFRRASVEKCRRFAGVAELLSGLKERGAKLYLLSNAQACFTEDELRETELSQYFNGILLSSEAGFKKPSARFFRAAFERFGLDPSRCVYVGNDLRDDVGGAHAVGMPCVYIRTEQSGVYSEAPVPDREAIDHAELARILFALAEEGGETRF